jgi:adenylate cyclase
LSEAVKLTWRLGAEEAVHAGLIQIEPAHVFVGICRVERVVREEAWERYAVSPERHANVAEEWNAVQGVMTAAGIDAVALRREVRAMWPQSSMVLSATQVAKRSEATKALFDQAEERAAQVGHSLTTLFDLLASVLNGLLKNGTVLPQQFIGPLRKLDTLMAPPPVAGVTFLLDATSTGVDEAPEHLKTTPREALFYDLPLQLATQANFQDMLDWVVGSLLKFFPQAERATLVLRDRTSNRLVLQAHVPAGKPSVSMELADHVLARTTALIWDPSSLPPDGVGARSMAQLKTTCAMYAPLHWQGDKIGVLCADTRKAGPPFTEDDLRLFVAITHHAALAIHSQRLTEDLKAQNLLLQRMMTHFSPKVRQRLLERASRGRLTLGGERSEVSILFSDIRGFTRMSAGMQPDDVVNMLNEYFGALVEAIFHNEGTVDKFIGDAILAVFGSPDPSAKHHEEALRAALAMQEAVKKLNCSRKDRGLPVCEIGIGIHSGEVLHGFVGTQERVEYTVVGDAVNRASRFCAAAEANEVLLSQDFHKHVWREVEVEAREIPTKHEGTWAAFRVVGGRTCR